MRKEKPPAPLLGNADGCDRKMTNSSAREDRQSSGEVIEKGTVLARISAPETTTKGCQDGGIERAFTEAAKRLRVSPQAIESASQRGRGLLGFACHDDWLELKVLADLNGEGAVRRAVLAAHLSSRHTRYQLFPDLAPDEYAALKADILEHGVLVPVEFDETGELLDGHHRVRAWRELREEGHELPDFPRITRLLGDEAAKRVHVRALNLLRRQLSKEEVNQHQVAMREDGASYREIAKATGTSEASARRAIKEATASNDAVQPARVIGKDGKSRPAVMPPRPRPAPSLFSSTAEEQNRAIDTMDELGADDFPAETIPTGAAEKIADRMARQEEKKRKEEDPDEPDFCTPVEVARACDRIRRAFHHWPEDERDTIRSIFEGLLQEDVTKWQRNDRLGEGGRPRLSATAEEQRKGDECKLRPIGPPRDGMQFARLAVMDLEKIREDDAERQQAFEHVKGWIADHED